MDTRTLEEVLDVLVKAGRLNEIEQTAILDTTARLRMERNEAEARNHQFKDRMDLLREERDTAVRRSNGLEKELLAAKGG